MAFKDYARPGKCQVCGKEADVAVACSTMGASSFAYCEDCASHGYEPYGEMVGYIACAGSWPDDINPAYQEIVRANLQFHKKTEAEFAHDVDHFFVGLAEYMAGLKERDGKFSDEDFLEAF